MPWMSSKVAQAKTGDAQRSSAAGPKGAALAPPRYGIDFVDRPVKRENKTGLPDRLKTGIENLSGMPMDDVRVHFNSSKPAQLQALAYTQGTNIYLGPGQERHLPHEAWHVVQQKHGRVRPTMQLKDGVVVNDEVGLEGEADVMGRWASEGKSVYRTRPGSISSLKADINVIRNQVIQKQGKKRKRGKGGSERGEPSTKRGCREQATDEEQESVAMTGEGGDREELEPMDTDGEQARGATEQKTDELFKKAKKSLEDRLARWKKRLGEGRKGKKSTAERKRAKLLTTLATARQFGTSSFPVLMWTHTAPPRIGEAGNEYHEGKDLAPGAQKYSYFRTGDNKQSELLKVQVGKKKQKIYVFDPQALKSYQKWYPKVKFQQKDPQKKELTTTAYLGERTRFVFSGVGAEVNSYTKFMVLKEQGRLKSYNPRRGEMGANTYLSTTKQDIVVEYVKNLLDDQKEKSNQEVKFPEDHLTQLLKHCRGLVEKFRDLQLTNYRVVLQSGSSGEFFTYPSLIIEPIIEPTKEDKRNAAKTGDLIKDFVKLFNEGSKIKIFERNSFGFLYPTISDLGRSIRIWPGLIDPDYLYERLANVLTIFDQPKETRVKAISTGSAEAAPTPMETARYPHTLLWKTLDRALEFVRAIYVRKGFTEDSLTNWYHQRLISNIAKAREFSKEETRLQDPVDLFLEVSQIIENLNEYGFGLITQQQKWTPTKENVTAAIKETYGRTIDGTNYEIMDAVLTHSGMQAANLAVTAVQGTHCERGPCYFELEHVGERRKKERAGKQETQQTPATGIYDPAYNFTGEADLKKWQTVPFPQGGKMTTMIVDITNITPDEIKAVILRHAASVLTFLFFGSLSKHFQLGMDKFTLGILIKATKKGVAAGSQSPHLHSPYMPPALMRYFIIMQEVQARRGRTGVVPMEVTGGPTAN